MSILRVDGPSVQSFQFNGKPWVRSLVRPGWATAVPVTLESAVLFRLTDRG